MITLLWLHKGKIREMGTHQELLAQRGLYYNLFLLQYKDDFKEGGGPVDSAGFWLGHALVLMGMQ